MDRNEAVLRELNLYPQWVRRDVPTQTDARTTVGAIDKTTGETTGGTTSHLTNPAKDAGQVIGYSHSAMPSAEKLLAVHPKDNSQAAGYRESPLRHAIPGNLDWTELKQQVRDCTACKLRAGCTQTVFGVGDEQAEWLFVGEGPGADEDAQGEPFVGQAGKLLDNMLLAIKLRRGKNVYITNIVKCRPPGNRTPEADEVAACLPYLQRQVELIKPKLIVALGKTAATALLGRDATLGSLRGALHDYHGIPLLITYHPAYLLRSPTEKAKAWQDLCLATDTMQKL